METVKYLIEWRKNVWNANENIEKDRQFRELAAEKLIFSADLRHEIYLNPELFIELFFVIVNKKKQVVPFFLNEVQNDFISRLNKAKSEYQEGKRAKLAFLILKGRQQGFTSLITAYQLAC